MGFSINRGTPSHHPFLDGIVHYKPSIVGVPPFQESSILFHPSCSKSSRMFPDSCELVKQRLKPAICFEVFNPTNKKLWFGGWWIISVNDCALCKPLDFGAWCTVESSLGFWIIDDIYHHVSTMILWYILIRFDSHFIYDFQMHSFFYQQKIGKPTGNHGKPNAWFFNQEKMGKPTFGDAMQIAKTIEKSVVVSWLETVLVLISISVCFHVDPYNLLFTT